MPTSVTRVAIVENHALFAESLAIALRLEGYAVTHVFLGSPDRDVGTLLPATMRHDPRVVVLGLNLGAHGSGCRLVESLTRAGVAVVVLASDDEPSRWGEALAHGARVVLSRNTSLQAIASAIRRVAQGQAVISREERAELVRAWHAELATVRQSRTRLELLTARESQVLGHLLEGHQVKQIASLSMVSEATVRSQTKAILAKLEVSSQMAAVGLARHAGWKAPD